MNKSLTEKYPYLANFITTAVKQNKLFHSIILYGGDIYMQYLFALEIARILNCENNGEDDCNCQNCRWIRANQHPAIKTVSKIDNKNDESKTVISCEQINELLNNLNESSDFKRVFILCDADIKHLTKEEREKYDKFAESGYNLPQQESNEKIWFPSGINYKCFPTVSANAMLKSVEEPPSNVNFIFLTENKDDLIQTIVSRSQAFHVGCTDKNRYDTAFLDKYFSKYPYFDKNSALDFAYMLGSYASNNDYEPDYVLNSILFYLTELLKANPDNNMLRNKILRDAEFIEKSKKMLQSYVKDLTVYENLAFYFANSGKNI